MLLDNKRLPQGNQILTRIMSLEINFREKKIFKFAHVQMALPKKEILNVLFFGEGKRWNEFAEWHVAWLAE